MWGSKNIVAQSPLPDKKSRKARRHRESREASQNALNGFTAPFQTKGGGQNRDAAGEISRPGGLHKGPCSSAYVEGDYGKRHSRSQEKGDRICFQGQGAHGGEGRKKNGTVTRAKTCTEALLRWENVQKERSAKKKKGERKSRVATKTSRTIFSRAIGGGRGNIADGSIRETTAPLNGRGATTRYRKMHRRVKKKGKNIC